MSESGATVEPVSQPAADAFPVPTAAVDNPGLWTAESLQRETVNRLDAQPWITHFEAEVMDEILSATHRLIERG